jgi:hypothetical protein
MLTAFKSYLKVSKGTLNVLMPQRARSQPLEITFMISISTLKTCRKIMVLKQHNRFMASKLSAMGQQNCFTPIKKKTF